MDSFACGLTYKVPMMSDSIRDDWLIDQQFDLEPVFDDFTADDDLLMEQILNNMNTTPIGQVLKKIASLPGVRKKKVLRVRKQLTQGSYDVNERLDFTLEKVLDDLNI